MMILKIEERVSKDKENLRKVTQHSEKNWRQSIGMVNNKMTDI